MSKIVLIADDNLVMRNLIKFYLKDFKFKILEAKDGIEALSLIKKKEVEILFLDINMPNLDGFNVAKYLEVTGKELDIISISSDLTRSNMIIMEEMGVKYFLTKPLNPTDFKKTIHDIIDVKEINDREEDS